MKIITEVLSEAMRIKGNLIKKFYYMLTGRKALGNIISSLSLHPIPFLYNVPAEKIKFSIRIFARKALILHDQPYKVVKKSIFFYHLG